MIHPNTPVEVLFYVGSGGLYDNLLRVLTCSRYARAAVRFPIHGYIYYVHPVLGVVRASDDTFPLSDWEAVPVRATFSSAEAMVRYCETEMGVPYSNARRFAAAIPFLPTPDILSRFDSEFVWDAVRAGSYGGHVWPLIWHIASCSVTPALLHKYATTSCSAHPGGDLRPYVRSLILCAAFSAVYALTVFIAAVNL